MKRLGILLFTMLTALPMNNPMASHALYLKERRPISLFFPGTPDGENQAAQHEHFINEVRRANAQTNQNRRQIILLEQSEKITQVKLTLESMLHHENKESYCTISIVTAEEMQRLANNQFADLIPHHRGAICYLTRYKTGITMCNTLDTSSCITPVAFRRTNLALPSDNAHTSSTDNSAKQCTVCNKQTTTRCQRCKKNYYCSTTCQRADWQNHKRCCSPLNQQQQQQFTSAALAALLGGGRTAALLTNDQLCSRDGCDHHTKLTCNECKKPYCSQNCQIKDNNHKNCIINVD